MGEIRNPKTPPRPLTSASPFPKVRISCSHGSYQGLGVLDDQDVIVGNLDL